MIDLCMITFVTIPSTHLRGNGATKSLRLEKKARKFVESQ